MSQSMNQADHKPAETLPGAQLDATKMPGHWLLARLGKRVLRPGGIRLTRAMIEGLVIAPTDIVVEFAPGLGITAQLTLQRAPAAYTGIERDEAAAINVQRFLTNPRYRCLVGTAEETGLNDQSATVIYGEAMLTMHTPAQKARIIGEAYRVLQPGGRYGIHELGLVPDTLDEATKETILRDVSQAIRVGARPLTSAEWRAMLEAEGFVIQAEARAPMQLLEPQRMLQDEGLLRTLRFAFNILRNGAARKRVFTMRRVFRQYQNHLSAIMLVAVKPSERK